MSKRTTLLSIGYWFSSTNLGMVAHPYKTVREIVREKEFSPLILSPFVWMLLFWVIATSCILAGRLLSDLSSFTYPRWFYDLLEFCFWWAVWFLGWWQVLVLYLYVRFRRVFQ